MKSELEMGLEVHEVRPPPRRGRVIEEWGMT